MRFGSMKKNERKRRTQLRREAIFSANLGILGTLVTLICLG